VSPELTALIQHHRDSLRRLVREHEPALARWNEQDPGLLEKEAAAALLHSFYTGVEFILRGILEEHGERPDKRGEWHVAMLRRAQEPGAARNPIIAPATGVRLREYLTFRHRFRNIYSFGSIGRGCGRC
jgi:hypothetical protein